MGNADTVVREQLGAAEIAANRDLLLAGFDGLRYTVRDANLININFKVRPISGKRRINYMRLFRRKFVRNSIGGIW